MLTKHFVDGKNNSELVADALESLTYQHPGLAFDRRHKILYSASHDSDKHVTLASGGGAGHEPAHAMYVGPGMLSAAISGNIFASPGVSQIYECIRSLNGAAGTILIIKKYTGDIFHFHQAAQKLRAELGIRVETVVVGDDVSLGRSKAGKVGRRGLAGTVLMHKVLGAMSTTGKSLDECLEVSRRVNAGLATIGVSLDHVHIPGQPLNAQQLLAADEIELGMGIHNEPGAKLLKPQPELGELVDSMLAYMLDESDKDRGYVAFSDASHTVLMVNNLGSLSVLELSAIATTVIRRLKHRGVEPSRVYSGTFMTSLNGPGFSITLLRADGEIIQYLDAPTAAPGWTVSFKSSAKPNQARRSFGSTDNAPGGTTASSQPSAKVDPRSFQSAIVSACQAAITAVPSITHYDTIVGDGDCGLTLARGCEAVLKLYEKDGCNDSRVLDHLLRVAHAVEENMDGTSGAIYGLFFNGLASKVRDLDPDTAMGLDEWALVAEEALRSVQRVTPARSGDRTMMDALEPFVGSLRDGIDKAVDAARRGAEGTKGLKPAFGRAVYVNEEGWEQVPDPGAISVVALVEGLAKGLRQV
ncbi:hypothetical protein ACJ41O_009825 [Fusarium nematophilum]